MSFRFINDKQVGLYQMAGLTHVVGFDTEYEIENREINGQVVEGNKVLSYQLHTVSFRSWNEKDLILYPKVRKRSTSTKRTPLDRRVDGEPEESFPTLSERLTLEELLKKAISSTGDKFKKCKILLVAHFGRAEWSTLADREAAKDEISLVRGVPVTLKPLKIGSNTVVWRDTLLLAPAGEGSLEALGKLSGVQKVEISKEYKEKMSNLLKEDKTKFEEYAITDTYVAVSYYSQVMEEAHTLAGDDAKAPMLPLTIGMISTQAFIKHWGGTENFEEKVRGRTKVTQTITDKNGNQKRVTNYSKKHETMDSEYMAAAAYAGGVNTSFVLGLTTGECTVLDIDFASAYPSAMSALSLIDYSQYPKSTRRLSELCNAEVAFAHVRFKFSTNNPLKNCLPISTENGLIYVMEGETICTGAELRLAHKNKAELEVRKGLILPTQEQKAFADFLRSSVSEREKYKKAGDKFKDKFYKEYNNSLYGKVAQAVRGKKSMDWRGNSQELKESRVSQPAYASMITALVRTALFELIDTLATDYRAKILSATTDGAMVIVKESRKDTLEEYFPGLFQRLLDRKGACTALDEGRVNMGFPSKSFLEIKKQADKAITVKTRVNVMFNENGAERVVVGKAMSGVHNIDPLDLPEKMKEDRIETQTKKSLAGAKKIVSDEILAKKLEKGNKEKFVADLVKVERTSKVNLDPDYKYKIVDGVAQSWETLPDQKRARKSADRIRRDGNRATPERVLLNMNDIKMTGGLYRTCLRQVFRLCKAELGGWRFTGTYEKTAEIFEVKLQFLKDATRTKVQMQKLPYTEEVENHLKEIAAKLGVKLIATGISSACGCAVDKKFLADCLRVLQVSDLRKTEKQLAGLGVNYDFVKNNSREKINPRTHPSTENTRFTLRRVVEALSLGSDEIQKLEALLN